MTIFTAYNMRSRGGAGLIWERFVASSAHQNIAVRYASPRMITDAPAALHAPCPCPAHALGNLIFMLRLFLHCLLFWRVTHGDVALTQGVLYTLPMLPLKWKGARLITLVHGDYFEELHRRDTACHVRLLLRALYEPMYRKSDLLMPISGDLARRLVERHGVSQDKIYEVRNSSPESTPSSPADLDRLRTELKIHKNETVLVYAGGLNPIKRVDRFIVLIATLSQDYTVRGIVVGDGPQRAMLEQQTRELEINDHVVFTGWKSPATPYIEMADLLVLCSDYEGCPTVLLEGLSLNCPMVASRVGGVPEILADDRLMFDPLIAGEMERTVRGVLGENGRVLPWVTTHLEAQKGRYTTPWEQQVLDAIMAPGRRGTAIPTSTGISKW